LHARYPGARLWAILEPRSNTLRRNVFQNELARSLAVADEVVVANVFKSESIPRTSAWTWPLWWPTCISREGARASFRRRWNRADVAPEMRPGDVVAILSNGGFGGIYEKLPQRLKAIAGGASGNQPLKASAKREGFAQGATCGCDRLAGCAGVDAVGRAGFPVFPAARPDPIHCFVGQPV